MNMRKKKTVFNVANKAIGRKTAGSMSLIDVAKRLRDERINRVVSGYREFRVSVTRTILLSIVILWALFFRFGSHILPKGATTGFLGQQLTKESNAVLPWLLGFLVISILWMICLRTGRLKESEWTDIVGSIANFLGIWVMLAFAWNLAIASITFLPLASIVIGARFNRQAFFVSIAASVIIVGIAAPDGYWINRPAFGIFALVLLIGLPLSVNRLLSALYVVSETAVFSRDAQSRFIATMSHELRTPLNTVVNAASLIETNQLSDADRQLMGSLTTNANALLHRVNEVLDVAAIDDGHLHFVNEPFRISTVLQAVQDIVGTQASGNGVNLQFHLHENVSDAIIGDPGRIEQVLTNLTSNAIKFTPPGGKVNVEVTVGQASNTAPITLTCIVSDTGIGISDKDKPKIFEPFHQVSGGVTRKHGGVGLGLHIVRSVSDHLGGQLSVSDNPGGGTVFTWLVSLPRAAPGQTATTNVKALDAIDHHRAHIPSMSCLVIDDNAPNRDIMNRILTRAGHRMIAAKHGPAGLEIMRGTEAVDAIFLDLHMPGMSGWQVLDALQHASKSNPIPPIVVLSADSDPESVASAHKNGAMAYLLKPISPQKLLGALELISVKNGNATAALTLAHSVDDLLATDSEQVSTLNVMRQLSTKDEIRQYLQTLIDEIDQNIAGLDTSLAKGDLNGANDCIHALKNTFQCTDFRSGVAACSDLSNILHSGSSVAANIAILSQLSEQAKVFIKNEPEFCVSV